MAEPSRQEEGHPLIVQRQEAAFIAAAEAAAELDVWLQMQRGNIRRRFEEFMLAFARLYRLTYQTNQLSDESEATKKTIEGIQGWLQETNIDQKRVRKGLDLFDEYQRLLFSSGLFTVKRQ